MQHIIVGVLPPTWFSFQSTKVKLLFFDAASGNYQKKDGHREVDTEWR